MSNDIKSKLAGFKLNSSTQYGLLVAITLLAAALRFYKLGAWSFWIDEVFTLRATPYISEWPLARLPINLVLIRGALDLLGTSEWSARLVPALVGILTIPVLYFPTRKIFGPAVALISALLLAVAPWHLYWSQNARFYVLLLLFYSLGMMFLFIGLEGFRRWYLFFGLFFLVLAIREKAAAFILVPVLASYILALMVLPFGKPAWLRLRYLVLILIPGILFILYDSYTFITIGYSQVIAVFTIFGGNPTEDPLRMLSFIGFEIGFPLMSLGFFGGLYLLLQKSRSGLFFSLGAVVPIAIVLLVTPFVFTEERYAFVTLPNWLILAAITIKELLNQTKDYGKLLAVGVLIVLLADAGGANLMYYQANNGNRRDWKGAFALVEERSREGDIIVSTGPELGSYYLGREIISWRDIDRDAVVQSGKRVWFVIVPDLTWFWHTQDFLWWVSHNSELIDIRYLRRPDNANIYIYLYDPAGPSQDPLIGKSN